MANYMTAIREIEQIVDNAPELNMNNYDEVQVDELNSAMIEICNILGNLSECESQEATIEAKAALPLQNVVGSASKSELIVKLIEKIQSESDNKQPLEYHSKMACGHGMVTLDIKIE